MSLAAHVERHGDFLDVRAPDVEVRGRQYA